MTILGERGESAAMEKGPPIFQDDPLEIELHPYKISADGSDRSVRIRQCSFLMVSTEQSD